MPVAWGVQSQPGLHNKTLFNNHQTKRKRLRERRKRRKRKKRKRRRDGMKRGKEKDKVGRRMGRGKRKTIKRKRHRRKNKRVRRKRREKKRRAKQRKCVCLYFCYASSNEFSTATFQDDITPPSVISLTLAICKYPTRLISLVLVWHSVYCGPTFFSFPRGVQALLHQTGHQHFRWHLTKQLS